MIILNDSFRRVNARGGRVGGVHELYPDAGRVVKPDDFDSRFNFTSITSDPIVGFGVIRNAVNDTGDGQSGGWSDLGYDWENGISKWEIKRINITIEVESESQFVRQPNILFDIESSVTGYREVLRTGSSIAELLASNVELTSSLENWNTTSDNWESLNELIIWSDSMYPPKTHISTLSSLISVSGASAFIKDQLIKRTANLLLELESSSVSTDIDSFGDWATSVNEWQNLGNTLWELYTSKTITDTASALISVSGSSSFLIDQITERTVDLLFELNSSANSQIEAFGDWGTSENDWQNLGETLWDIYVPQTHTDTTSALISVSSNSSFLIDQLIKRTANVAIGLNSNSTFFIDQLVSSGASASLEITATVTPQVISFGSWALTNTNWESTNNVWEVYSSDIDIDTANASISISTIAGGYIDTIYTRTASASITISASTSSDSDTIFTRSGATSISIGATATKTIILGWGTSTVSWSNYNTNWEAN